MTQLERVRDVMELGANSEANPWMALWQIKHLIEIRHNTMDSEAAISARLRQLRAEGWIVDKRKRKGSRAWEYRVSKPGQQGSLL